MRRIWLGGDGDSIPFVLSQVAMREYIIVCCECVKSSREGMCEDYTNYTICIIAGGVRSIARENCSSFPGISSSRNTFTPLSIGRVDKIEQSKGII